MRDDFFLSKHLRCAHEYNTTTAEISEYDFCSFFFSSLVLLLCKAISVFLAAIQSTAYAYSARGRLRKPFLAAGRKRERRGNRKERERIRIIKAAAVRSRNTAAASTERQIDVS